MKINLPKLSCVELEITGTIKIPLPVKNKLWEVATKANQMEDAETIFFHQDYMRSKTKHHFEIEVENLPEQDQAARVELYYAIVDPGKIYKTKYPPEYLMSLVKKDSKLFECKCEFDLHTETIAAPLSAMPLKLSSAEGDVEVVYKGAYITLLEGGNRTYDLSLHVSHRDQAPAFKFTFEFTHEDELSASLPQNVLNRARSYVSQFLEA